MLGKDFLKIARQKMKDKLPPVIIYTGEEVTDAQINEIEDEVRGIIVKGARSPDRLLDETLLFLHELQSNLPISKQKIIWNLHDPTRVLKGKSILVVDDDYRNIMSLNILLEDHGVNVDQAENGKIALKKLEEKNNFDLILMDMMMPEMDGYEATGLIRRSTRYKDIPIIALTAKAMKGEREKCLTAGCSDYISKPVNNDKLLSLLRIWLYVKNAYKI